MNPHVSRESPDTLRYKTARVLRYNADTAITREIEMKQFFAVAAFLFGGIATELAHPVQCLSIATGRMQIKRKKP
ncbi:hypothetical protein YK56LOC_12890 [Caballeronia sp. HLA56]